MMWAPALTTFKFHCVCSGLHEAGCGGKGVLDRVLVGAERQIGHDHGARGRASNGCGGALHVFQGDGQRRAVAKNHVAERIADEQHVHARCFENGRGESVVCGEHREGNALGLGLRDVLDAHALGGKEGGRLDEAVAALSGCVM